MGSEKQRYGGSCLECGTRVSGRFCADCGAEQRAPLRPLGDWARGAYDQALEFDVRLIRTLRRPLFSPGALTREYASGRQRLYTPPIRLYVVTSAVVLALINVLGVFELDQILSTWSADARAALAAATGVSDAFVSLVFLALVAVLANLSFLIVIRSI